MWADWIPSHRTLCQQRALLVAPLGIGKIKIRKNVATGWQALPYCHSHDTGTHFYMDVYPSKNMHTSAGRKFALVEGLSHDLVCTGSIYHVHFAWQVWHGQISPRFKFDKLKSFSGVEIDQNHVDKRILRGKGFCITFVRPVYFLYFLLAFGIKWQEQALGFRCWNGLVAFFSPARLRNWE